MPTIPPLRIYPVHTDTIPPLRPTVELRNGVTVTHRRGDDGITQIASTSCTLGWFTLAEYREYCAVIGETQTALPAPAQMRASVYALAERVGIAALLSIVADYCTECASDAETTAETATDRAESRAARETETLYRDLGAAITETIYSDAVERFCAHVEPYTEAR